MTQQSKYTPGPRIGYIVGKTLIHIDLHEGPINAPKVTALFSIPKKHEKYAILLVSHAALLETIRTCIEQLEFLDEHTGRKGSTHRTIVLAQLAIEKAEGISSEDDIEKARRLI